MAGFKSLKTFARNASKLSIELHMDNTTAVAYVNKNGGTRSKACTAVALQIARWCESKTLSLTAIFVPGVFNVHADRESRRSPEAGDWKLCRSSFRSIESLWGPEVDLFASSWNNQLPVYVSWFPLTDHWRTDAFSFCWRGSKGYAFPPFGLIKQCLAKIQREEAEIILVCPFWPSQPWYPLLLEMACDIPRVFRHSFNLLTSCRNEPHPLLTNRSLCLTAWKLSGVAMETSKFRRMWLNCSLKGLGKPHTLLMEPPGALGTVGVFQGATIPCQAI